MTLLDTPAERVLGSPAKIRIMTRLTSWAGSELTERQLAKLCGLSTFGIRHALADLERCLVVTKKRIGRAHVWQINKKSYAYRVLKPVLERIANLPSPLRVVQSSLVKTLPLRQIHKLVLFGSALDREVEEPGDVDIAIILKARKMSADDKERYRDIVTKISGELGPQIGKRLEPHIFSIADWERNSPLMQAIHRGKELYPHAEV